MIAGIFHQGSGLGNQLHRYVGARCVALDKDKSFTMVAPELFKGKSFMNLDMGTPMDIPYVTEFPSGKVVPTDTAGVEVVDGEFQGEEDFIHHLDKVKEWLKVEPLDMPDDLCVINFRGGEYVGVSSLFLGEEYWQQAISLMRMKHPNIRFEVHTDDPVTAEQFFDFPIVNDIATNWRAIRYAKHLIISNSSFAILPALLGDADVIFAPKYWAGHNKGYWQLPENQYKRFTYI